MFNATWLDKPYPLIESNRQKLILVLGFGMFTYIFLMIFKPFRAIEIGANQIWFLFGFGVSVSLALTFTYFVFPIIFKKWFVQEKWQIKNEIIFLVITFFVVAIFNYTYNETIGVIIHAPRYNFLQYLGITFSIGIFPTIILVFSIELYLNRRNNQQAQALYKQKDTLVSTKTPDKNLIIRPSTANAPILKIAPDNFILAQSDNNYISVFYIESDELKRQLIRLSMKKLEIQCQDFDFIIRCHRSFIINKNKIQRIEGNARSLVLQLENYENEVPVSRTFPKEDLI